MSDFILQTLKENDTKDVFKKGYTFFPLILTITLTSCFVERCFSCLKKINMFLRNVTLQDRLNKLTNNIHREEAVWRASEENTIL